MLDRLSRLPNYVKALGPSGLGVFLRHELAAPHQGAPARPLEIPAEPRPIWLRPTRGDRATFWQVFVRSEYAFDDFRQAEAVHQRYRAMLARGVRPIVLDCGANIGLAARWFARTFPEAWIVAIEPDRDNFGLLERNLAHLPHARAVHGGVWDRPARLAIENPDAGSASFRVVEREDGLQAWTVPQLLELVDGEPLVVKIDIEGGEAALFRSGTDWVREIPLIVVELHDWLLPWRGSSRPLLRTLAPLDVDYLFRGENLFCFQAPPAAG